MMGHIYHNVDYVRVCLSDHSDWQLTIMAKPRTAMSKCQPLNSRSCFGKNGSKRNHLIGRSMPTSQLENIVHTHIFHIGDN